jgi:hypothetical protein
MAHSDRKELLEQLRAKLAQQLLAMHGSETLLKLLLLDMKFEMDAIQNQAAAAMAAECIARHQTRRD